MRASAVAGIVFANINDNLMRKLTSKRSLASVPFGARYRVIDFALSNLVNAGVSSVGIITKENYRSLMDHVGSGVYWDLDRKNGGLYLLPPYLTSGIKRYNGTVDALYGAMDYIERCNADYIVLCRADSIANIDIGAAVKAHADKNADVTLVYHRGKPPLNNTETAYPVFGKNGRITAMNYEARDGKETDYGIGVAVISRELLIKTVTDGFMDGAVSFMKDIIAENTGKLKIYGFEHKEYAAVFDGINSYYDASMDLLKGDVRRQLFSPDRPVFTKTRDDMPTRYGTKSSVQNCLIADGCVVNGTVKNSILFRGVTVEKGAVVENCILMQETKVGENTGLCNVIADKNAVISGGMVLKGAPGKSFFIKKNQIV